MRTLRLVAAGAFGALGLIVVLGGALLVLVASFVAPIDKRAVSDQPKAPNQP